MKKTLFTIFIFISLQSLCQTQTLFQQKSIEAYAKIYGVVKYYYPDSIDKNFKWDNFGVNAINELLKSKNKFDLIKKLEIIFEPVAPLLIITSDSNYTYTNNAPVNKSDTYRFWQYKGFSNEEDEVKKYVYNKKLVRNYNYNNPVLTQLEFNYAPLKNEVLKIKLFDSAYCYIPICLNEKNIQRIYTTSYKKAFKKCKKIENSNLQHEAINFLVEIWNIVQHFYPLTAYTNYNFDSIFNYVPIVLKSESKNDLLKIKYEILNKFKDGHSSINREYCGLGLDYLQIDTFYYINKCSKVINLKPGDLILSVNKTSPHNYFTTSKSYFTGSDAFVDYTTSFYFGFGFYNDTVDISVLQNKKDTLNVKLVRDKFFMKNFELLHSDRPEFYPINDSIVYINLCKLSYPAFLKLKDSLAYYKGIIADERHEGYPNQKLLGFFSSDTLRSPYFVTAQNIYPFQKNVLNDTAYFNIVPQTDQIKSKIVFLIGNGSISATETSVSIIKNYKLGTIIGEKTAGCNGNAVYFVLKYFTFYFTGMEVINQDKSTFNNIGISPDIEVKPTLSGIKAGKDEVLEYAIEYLQKKLVNEK